MKSPVVKAKTLQIDRADSNRNQSSINEKFDSKRGEDITEFNPNMQYMDTQEIEENFKETNMNYQDESQQ